MILWGGAARRGDAGARARGHREPRIDPEIQRFVAILATGFVLVTLLVNGTTLRPMIRLLGIDRLSPIDQALRHQVLALVAEQRARRHRPDRGRVPDRAGPDRRRAAAVRGADRRGCRAQYLRYRDRRPRPASRSACSRSPTASASCCSQHFRHRSVSRAILEQLLAAAERLSTARAPAGRTGYIRAARRLLAFGPGLPARPPLAPLRRPGPAFVRLTGRSLRAPAGQQDRARGAGAVGAPEMPACWVHGSPTSLAKSSTSGFRPRRRASRRCACNIPPMPKRWQRRFLRQSALRLEGAQYQDALPGGPDRPRALQQSPA